MKVFISQPIKNKTVEEIKKEREKAIDHIAKLYPDEKIDVIASSFDDASCNEKELWLLGKEFELLSDVDLAYFCKDWYKCKECKLEHKACAEYGIDTAYPE